MSSIRGVFSSIEVHKRPRCEKCGPGVSEHPERWVIRSLGFEQACCDRRLTAVMLLALGEPEATA